MKRTSVLLSATAACFVLAACSGSETPAGPVFEGDLAEARNCATPEADSAIFSDAFDTSIRNAAANAEQSAAFIELARAGSCVFELESGLLYRIRTAQADTASPTLGDRVTVHYRGLHPDGVAFNDSYAMGDPVTFPSDRLIPAWRQALPLMREGELWELYVSPDLGYGQMGTPGGPIAPNEALVFTLELLDLPDAQDADDAEAE
ncbi:FKBP-type peptidyl-prolyl cis-trans isomerase [Maricaulis sp.]|uniref:FKBP-type peptidyl-prolyl cis-trans isomerase n=1 Tax=Maricaulis sp. TaxID=1486257 RepID=UPI00261D71F7|nr:FKBP-type peptidyl-prolyl cis-trans isomerase [Maricaulis sp.]